MLDPLASITLIALFGAIAYVVKRKPEPAPAEDDGFPINDAPAEPEAMTDQRYWLEAALDAQTDTYQLEH